MWDIISFRKGVIYDACVNASPPLEKGAASAVSGGIFCSPERVGWAKRSAPIAG